MNTRAVKNFAVLGALLLLGACAQMAGRAAPSDVSDRDAMFMRDAAAGSVAEVRLGQLALQNAASEEVKRYANTLVNDHTVADQQIRTIAERKNVELPAQPDATHQMTLDRLAQLKGAEFDRQYLAAMARDHEKTVSEFRAQAAGGQDPDVRAFADKNLPVLERHLERTKTLHGKVAG